MKFPLIGQVFPPVVLSSQEKEKYTKLASKVLADAIAEYELYEYRRHMNRDQWKPIRTREDVVIYRQRRKYRKRHGSAAMNDNNIYHRSSSLEDENDRLSSSSDESDTPETEDTPAVTSTGFAEQHNWSLPALIGRGIARGTVEDCVYGMATPEASMMLVKATYTDDEIVDGNVLAQIQGPTPNDPLRFLGLKWLVKAHPAGLGAFLRPRDLVYLETTGIVTRSDGSRIGHFLLHSVDVPGCGELTQRSIIRGRISSVFLFKQLPNNQVDVFMKGQVEPNGKIVDSLAILSTTNGLCCFAKSIIVAENRKLAWLLQHPRKHYKFAPEGSRGTWYSQCNLCRTPFSAFVSSTVCELCGVAICSKCRVTKKLTFVSKMEMHRQAIDFCTACVTKANKESAIEIAKQEILSGRYGSIPSSSSSKTTVVHQPPLVLDKVNDIDDDLEQSVESLAKQLATTGSIGKTEKQSVSQGMSFAYLKDLLDTPESSVQNTTTPLKVPKTDDVESESMEKPAPIKMLQQALSMPGQTNEQREMWIRITELHMAADATYHFTKKTSDLHLGTGGSCSSSPTSLDAMD